MKNEFYSSHNLSFKEKRNKFGRYTLIFCLIISTLLTLTVVFFMIINNLGISPSDQQGFKGVRYDVGQEIIKNFKTDATWKNDTEYTIKYNDSTIYSFKIKQTEEAINYEEVNMTSSYYINIDKTKETFEEGGKNSSLLGSIKTYEEAINFVCKSIEEYRTSFLDYSATYYSKITNYEHIRYFYNAEKRQLKFAGYDDEFIIVDDYGHVLKGLVNVRGNDAPLLYKINRTNIQEIK